jgi:hypothetical protein
MVILYMNMSSGGACLQVEGGPIQEINWVGDGRTDDRVRSPTDGRHVEPNPDAAEAEHWRRKSRRGGAAPPCFYGCRTVPWARHRHVMQSGSTWRPSARGAHMGLGAPVAHPFYFPNSMVINSRTIYFLYMLSCYFFCFS